MPKVNKHHCKNLSNDKIECDPNNMNTSISSSYTSSSTPSISRISFKKSYTAQKNLNDIASPIQTTPTRPRSTSNLSNNQINFTKNSFITNSTKSRDHFDLKKHSSKRANKRFHQLFPSVSLNETVVDTYSCAYVKSLNLLHGVMFLTKNYICFYSKILTSENILILKLQHINSVKKTMHAFIFPTAIRIDTQNSSYQFTSFRSRSNTLDHLVRLINNFQQKLENQSIKNQLNYSSKVFDLNKQTESSTHLVPINNQPDVCSEAESLEEKDNDLMNKSLNCEEYNNEICTPVATYFNNFIAYDKFKNQNLNELNSVPYISNSCYNYYNSPNKMIYDIDYSDLSRNKVTISLRHNKSLIEKVKVFISFFMPPFSDISRIESLLPICFLMCILLLLNAFVLLNKVSKVDELFGDLLIQSETILN